MTVNPQPFRLLLLLWLALLAAPGFALGPGRSLREYGQQTWQSDSGLPQNTVRAILQTCDGFLWLGTEAGLVRFDGVEFRVFDSANTLALHSGFIAGLAEDPAGTLWIATADGLVSEQAGRFAAYGTAQGLPSANVLAVHMTPQQQVLALTAVGAAVLDGTRFRPLPGSDALGLSESAAMSSGNWIAGSAGVLSLADPHPTLLPQIGQVQAIALSGPDLWAGGSSGLLRLGSRTRLSAHEGLPSDDVTALLATPSGLWVGTSKGLARISPAGLAVTQELAGRRIESLYLDREGSLWAATDEGIARISNGRVEYTLRRPTLPGVLAMYEDREGSMWFGTDAAGLSVLRAQSFSTLTAEDGLSPGAVRSVFEDHAGTVWLGTGSGLDRYTEGRVTHFEGALPSRVILALAETTGPGETSLWVGTPAGLVCIQGSSTKTYTTADGLADDFVRSLYADRDGSLWIGTRNGLSEWKKGRFQSWSKRSWSTLDGLGSDLIGAILRTRDGTLWVGTLGGLSYLAGHSFHTLPAAGVTALLEDSRGTLWVATNGAGLSLVHAGKLVPLPAGSGLPMTIYGILEDASAHLWLSSRTGIVRVPLADLEAFAHDPAHPPPIDSFGTADGMRIREASSGGHPAAWRAHDGALWFATLNGAAIVHPESLTRNTVPPLVALDQVRIDGVAAEARAGLRAGSVIRVPAGHSRLTIDYSGLSFIAPAKVRYRTMLAGFDKSWIDAGTRRSAFYTNVPPGHYRFLVEATNNDGVWSVAPAEIAFDVQPFYYQTAWFYALLALAVGVAAALVYRWRVQSVAAGYAAVLEERGRIAREIHDTLAQGYVAISVQIELAERLLATSSAAAAQQLRATRALVRESLEDARSSIWNLRAQAEAGTLPAQLAETVRRAGERSPATIRFAVHGTYRSLPPPIEPEVHRIAGEALANAVKHAAASTVAVTLTYSEAVLVLQVADDGIGLPAHPERPRHFGLQGMRERAARIHAILNIEAAPDTQGTVVTLQVPSP